MSKKTSADQPANSSKDQSKNPSSAADSQKIKGTDQSDIISGGAGDDKLDGKKGDDAILGGAGNDKLTGGKGNDTLTGGLGNDEIDGKDGHDTAAYAGSVLDFEWTIQNDNIAHVTDLNTADGDEGTDRLKHVEAMQFDDYTFVFGQNNAALVNAAHQTATEDDALEFTFDAYDFDGGTVTVDTVSVTGQGSVTLLSGATDLASGMGSGSQFSLRFEPGEAYQHLAVGQVATETVTITVSDGQGGVTTREITLTITGSNDAPVITSDAVAASGAVTEAGSATAGIPVATGQLAASDVDAGASLSWSGSAAGALGSFAIDADTGAWSYALDQQAADSLAEGESREESFTVIVTDEHGATAEQVVTLTVTGSNDAPVVTGGDIAGAVTEAGSATAGIPVATGQLAAADVDAGATQTWSGNAAGTYGSFAIDATTGEWSFVLDQQAADSLAQGDIRQEAFTVLVTDEHGATAEQVVTITITGSDDAPVITSQATAATGAVVEAGAAGAGVPSATGQLTATTTVEGGLTWSGDAAGAFGAFSIDAQTGQWVYALDQTAADILTEGEQRTETFTVTVTDTLGYQAQETVTVAITGTNDAPRVGLSDTQGEVQYSSAGAVHEPGPIVFTVEQYLNYNTNNFDAIRGHVASQPADFTVETNVIDYSDSPNLIQGNHPGFSPFPAAEASGNQSPYGDNDNFIVHVTTDFIATESGHYTFSTSNDDGVYLLIDGQLIIADGSYHPQATFSAGINLSAGAHTLELFYFEGGGQAGLELSVTSPSGHTGLMGDPESQLVGTPPLTDTGIIQFSDVDGTITSVTVSDHGAAGELIGTMTVRIIDDQGTVEWTYTAPDNNPALFTNHPEQSFIITVTDDTGATQAQHVRVYISPASSSPVITSSGGALNGTVIEAGHNVDGMPSTGGQLFATDADLAAGDRLAWSGNTESAYGTFTIDADSGAWVYTLNQSRADELRDGALVTETFTVQVSDLYGQTDTQTVSVTIQGTNDAPVVSGGLAVGEEDVTLRGSLRDYATITDAEGPVRFISEIVTSEFGAQVFIYSDGTFAYIPVPNFNGPDTFDFTVADPEGVRVTTSFEIIVSPVNDAPRAAGDSGITTSEDAAVMIPSSVLLANDTDLDGDVLSIIDVSPRTANGATVTLGEDGSIQYDPTGAAALQALVQGQSVTDSFTYTVSDGNGGTSIATVSIVVDGANEAPVAQADRITVTQNQSASGNVVANDAVTGGTDNSGNILTNGSFEIGHGVPPGGIGYPTSLPGWTSTQGSFEVWGDGFLGNRASEGTSFLELDNGGGQDTYSSHLSTDAGREYTLTFDLAVRSGTSPQTNQVEFLVNGESLGVFTPTSTSFTTYTVTFIGTGNDVIAFREPASANDGVGGLIDNLTISAAADVFITAVGGNDLAVGQAVAGDNGGQFTVNANGDYTFNPGSDFAYLAEGEVATTQVSYTVTDGAGSSTSTIEVEVIGQNDAPIAGDLGVRTTESRPVTLTPSYSDADLSDTHSLSVDTSGTSGQVTVNADGTFTYDPSGAFDALYAGETAVDTFIFTVDDGHGGVSTGEISVTIDGEGAAPGHTLASGPVTLPAGVAARPSGTFQGISVDPVTGKVYVTNSERDGTIDVYGSTADFEAGVRSGTVTLEGGAQVHGMYFSVVDDVLIARDSTVGTSIKSYDMSANGAVIDSLASIPGMTGYNGAAGGFEFRNYSSVNIIQGSEGVFALGKSDVDTWTLAELDPVTLEVTSVESFDLGADGFAVMIDEFIFFGENSYSVGFNSAYNINTNTVSTVGATLTVNGFITSMDYDEATDTLYYYNNSSGGTSFYEVENVSTYLFA